MNCDSFDPFWQFVNSVSLLQEDQDGLIEDRPIIVDIDSRLDFLGVSLKTTIKEADKKDTEDEKNVPSKDESLPPSVLMMARKSKEDLRHQVEQLQSQQADLVKKNSELCARMDEMRAELISLKRSEENVLRKKRREAPSDTMLQLAEDLRSLINESKNELALIREERLSHRAFSPQLETAQTQAQFSPKMNVRSLSEYSRTEPPKNLAKKEVKSLKGSSPKSGGIKQSRRSTKKGKSSSAQSSQRYVCRSCGLLIGIEEDVISKSYQVSVGSFSERKRGYLFRAAVNLNFEPEREKAFTTGKYMISLVKCKGCSTQLGWKYTSSQNDKNRNKVGKFVLARYFLKNMDPPSR